VPPAETKHQCPYCNGTGKAKFPKSLWELLNGGICARCAGTGRFNPVDTSILALIIAVALVALALALGYLFTPFLLGAYLLLVGWRSQPHWIKFLWAASFFVIAGAYPAGWSGVLDALRYDWAWIETILPAYYLFGSVALVVVTLLAFSNKSKA
jgi:hypothetical protein